MNSLTERSGLIVGPGIYSFAHKSIAEYLVAEAILEGDQRDGNGQRIDRLRLFKYRDNDRWNTATFLWAGLAPITDLESFVDACMDANDLPLACGLIVDQLPRFSGESLHRLALKALVLFKGVPGYGLNRILRHWGPDEAASTELQFPDLELRKLGFGMGSFYDLIFDMVEKEILSWPDIKKLRGLGRNLLWLALASTPTQDLVEWKRHFQKPFPWRKYLMFHHGDSVDKVGTQLCIIEDGLFWGARRYFGNQNLLHGITRIYGEVWPECRRFLPLTLMSVGNALLDAETAQKEAFAGIARILSSIDSAQVDAGWLSGTREWTVRWREAPDDLLLTYSSGLEEVYREGYVDTDRYTAARQFVDGLIDKRKYLLAREGPKMG